MTTEFGLKQYKKWGKDSHYKGLVSGDVIRYNPLRARFYWHKESASEPPKKKLTKMKEYVVEYAYSSLIQIKCDTGRVVSYCSLSFETKRNSEWTRT